MHSITELQQIIENGVKEINYPATPNELYEPIAYLMALGGKRLRPALVLMATDLFNTQEFNIESRYLNQYNTSIIRQDTRTVKLGFRYNFGNTNLETNQRTKSQEVTERLEKK